MVNEADSEDLTRMVVGSPLEMQNPGNQIVK